MDNFRRFILVFTVFLFLAIGISGYVIALRYDEAANNTNEFLKGEGEPYDPNSTSEPVNYNFRDNILVVISDTGRSEVDLMCLMNYNTAASSLSLLYLPKELKVPANVGVTDPTATPAPASEQLGRIYSQQGMEKTVSLVSSFLEVSIPYYVHLNGDQFIQLVDSFSSQELGVKFTLPVDIAYTSHRPYLINNMPFYAVRLYKGEQLFTGTTALQLLQFHRTDDDRYSGELLSYYNGRDRKRIEMVQKFTYNFLIQAFGENANEHYADQFLELLQPLITAENSNLTTEHLMAIERNIGSLTKDSISYYVANGKDIFQEEYYLSYNATFTDMLSAADFSNVTADSILTSKFVSST